MVGELVGTGRLEFLVETWTRHERQLGVAPCIGCSKAGCYLHTFDHFQRVVGCECRLAFFALLEPNGVLENSLWVQPALQVKGLDVGDRHLRTECHSKIRFAEVCHETLVAVDVLVDGLVGATFLLRRVEDDAYRRVSAVGVVDEQEPRELLELPNVVWCDSCFNDFWALQKILEGQQYLVIELLVRLVDDFLL